MAGGTLESSGANGAKIPAGNCRDLGYTSITDNASTSPRLRGSLDSNGINKTGDKGASLVSAIDTSADTKIEPFPEGTVESSGANG